MILSVGITIALFLCVFCCLSPFVEWNTVRRFSVSAMFYHAFADAFLGERFRLPCVSEQKCPLLQKGSRRYVLKEPSATFNDFSGLLSGIGAHPSIAFVVFAPHDFARFPFYLA